MCNTKQPPLPPPPPKFLKCKSDATVTPTHPSITPHATHTHIHMHAHPNRPNIPFHLPTHPNANRSLKRTDPPDVSNRRVVLDRHEEQLDPLKHLHTTHGRHAQVQENTKQRHDRYGTQNWTQHQRQTCKPRGKEMRRGGSQFSQEDPTPTPLYGRRQVSLKKCLWAITFFWKNFYFRHSFSALFRLSPHPSPTPICWLILF